MFSSFYLPNQCTTVHTVQFFTWLFMACVVLVFLLQHGLDLLHLLHGFCCHHSQHLHQDSAGVQAQPHQGLWYELQGSASAPPVLHTAANKQLLWVSRQASPFSVRGSWFLHWAAEESAAAGTRAGPGWGLGTDNWRRSVLGMNAQGLNSGVWEAKSSEPNINTTVSKFLGSSSFL